MTNFDRVSLKSHISTNDPRFFFFWTSLSFHFVHCWLKKNVHAKNVHVEAKQGKYDCKTTMKLGQNIHW